MAKSKKDRVLEASKAEGRTGGIRTGRKLKLPAKIRTKRVVTPLSKEAVHQEIQAVLEHSRSGHHTPARIGPIVPIQDEEAAVSFEAEARFSHPSAADSLHPADSAYHPSPYNGESTSSSDESPLPPSSPKLRSPPIPPIDLGIKSIEDAPRMALVREAAFGARGIPFIPRYPSVLEASMGPRAPSFLRTRSGLVIDENALVPFQVDYRSLFEPAPRPLAVFPASDKLQSMEEANPPSLFESELVDPTQSGDKPFAVDTSKRFEPSPPPMRMLDETRSGQTTLGWGSDTVPSFASEQSNPSEKNNFRPSSSENNNLIPSLSEDSSGQPEPSSPSNPDDPLRASWLLAAGLIGLLMVLMWFGGQMGANPNSSVNSLFASTLTSNSLTSVSSASNRSNANSSTPLPPGFPLSSNSPLSPAVDSSHPILQAYYLRMGDEAIMPDGLRVRFESIQASAEGLMAQVRFMDASGRIKTSDLVSGQSTHWVGSDGSFYSLIIESDPSSAGSPGLRLVVTGASEIHHPGLIRVSAPAYAYLLDGQFPSPLLLDNRTLSIGQSISGGLLSAQLTAIASDPSGARSATFRLFDSYGDEAGLLTLASGQMAELRLPSGGRYTLLMRDADSGRVQVQLYLNHAFQ